MINPLINFEQVTFSYAPKHLLLKDINFSIYPGEVVCMIGPNGSGKSTIARLLLGLIRPQQGRISVLGISPELSRTEMAYVPQHIHFDPLFPVSVIDIILMGRKGNLFGGIQKKDKEYALSTLQRVHLQEYAGHPFASLSGGQRQRVLIARALADERWRILLMDEPSAHVDSEFQSVLETILADCPPEKAILCISHDIDFVNKQFNRVLCMHNTILEHNILKERKGTNLLSGTYSNYDSSRKIDHSSEIQPRG